MHVRVGVEGGTRGTLTGEEVGDRGGKRGRMYACMQVASKGCGAPEG